MVATLASGPSLQTRIAPSLDPLSDARAALDDSEPRSFDSILGALLEKTERASSVHRSALASEPQDEPTPRQRAPVRERDASEAADRTGSDAGLRPTGNRTQDKRAGERSAAGRRSAERNDGDAAAQRDERPQTRKRSARMEEPVMYAFDPAASALVIDALTLGACASTGAAAAAGLARTANEALEPATSVGSPFVLAGPHSPKRALESDAAALGAEIDSLPPGAFVAIVPQGETSLSATQTNHVASDAFGAHAADAADARRGQLGLRGGAGLVALASGQGAFTSRAPGPDPLSAAPRFDAVEATFIGFDPQEPSAQGNSRVYFSEAGPLFPSSAAVGRGAGAGERTSLEGLRAPEGFALEHLRVMRTVSLPASEGIALISDQPASQEPVFLSATPAQLTAPQASERVLHMTRREVTIDGGTEGRDPFGAFSERPAALLGEAPSPFASASASGSIAAPASAKATGAGLAESLAASALAQDRARDLAGRIFLPRRDMAALHADLANLRSEVNTASFDENVFSGTSSPLGGGNAMLGVEATTSALGRSAAGTPSLPGTLGTLGAAAFANANGLQALDLGGHGQGSQTGSGSRREGTPLTQGNETTRDRDSNQVTAFGLPLPASSLVGESGPSAGNGATDTQSAQSISKAAFERVQDRAAELQARGGGMAKVNIRDARLGEVNLRVNMGGDGKVHVEIATSDARVKKEIEKGLDELKANLEKQSLKVGDVKVTAEARSSSQGGSEQQRPQQQQQQSNNAWQDAAQRAQQDARGFGGDPRGGRREADGPVSGGLESFTRSAGKNSAGADNNAVGRSQRSVQRGNNGSLKVFA